jgi:hypothetical protein
MSPDTPVVQLDELGRNKMAPEATPTMLEKWQKTAEHQGLLGAARCNQPP